MNKILLLTNNADDALTLQEALGNGNDRPFEVEWLRDLSKGVARLSEENVDAVLLDLSLSDSSGIATLDKLFAASPHTLILLLCANEEEPLAIEAATRGAQGYFSQAQFKSHLVSQGLRNIIQRKIGEESLFQQKARAEIALNSISDAVLCTDVWGNIDYMNISAEKLTGWTKKEALGRAVEVVFKIIDGDTKKPLDNIVDLVLKEDKAMGLPANTMLIRQDGSEVSIEDSTSPIHDLNGRLSGTVIVFHDVSATKAMTLKMTHLAHHDFLTNLPNRVLLNDRITQGIATAKRNGSQLAVLFLDLDNFKHINDSLGHLTGDTLLQAVTHRLSTCVRSSDTVSRSGGDEFVILLTESSGEENAAVTAEKILAAMTLPHSVSKQQLYVTTSIGISVYPADGEDAETLIKNADTAMYNAKENGRNNYKFFRHHMNTLAVERQVIEASLRQALEKDEFDLHYQPKVNLKTGAITGVEALLRWIHPKWGMVLPDRFLPIAEESGLIVPIGRWVLRKACAQTKLWLDAGLGPVNVAVNISALEFRQPGFLAGVRTILNETGLAPPLLTLEITESVLMRNAESSTTILKELKNIGVKLAVDDFGTGYSSLSYLQQFPIDVLKIDRSFVSEINSISEDGFIVSAVIGMGNSLKLQIVAEGIETQTQLAFLQARECEEGQGYYFSAPLNAAKLAAMLESGIVATIDY